MISTIRIRKCQLRWKSIEILCFKGKWEQTISSEEWKSQQISARIEEKGSLFLHKHITIINFVKHFFSNFYTLRVGQQKSHIENSNNFEKRISSGEFGLIFSFSRIQTKITDELKKKSMKIFNSHQKYFLLFFSFFLRSHRV